MLFSFLMNFLLSVRRQLMLLPVNLGQKVMYRTLSGLGQGVPNPARIVAAGRNGYQRRALRAT